MSVKNNIQRGRQYTLLIGGTRWDATITEIEENGEFHFELDERQARQWKAQMGSFAKVCNKIDIVN